MNGEPLVEYRMSIGGERRKAAGGAAFDSVDPYDGKAWATVPEGSAADVDDAVDAARRSFEGEWGALSGYERGRLLERLAAAIDERAEHLAGVETRDNGKLLRDSRAQVAFAARCYRYYAGVADKIEGEVIPVDREETLDYLVREPVGVCALLIAWNSPLQLLANKLAPALAAGNTVVVKPSEFASASIIELASMLGDLGFPDGTVNVVTGTGAEVGAALARHAGVDLVSFTGGVATGRAVLQATGENLARLVLELGGKSPNIVFADADRERALAGVLRGIFTSAGQTCIAGSRLLVEDAIADEFVAAVTERAAALKLGDPRDPATEIGPLANRPQLERVVDYIERGVSEGADLLCGGGRPPAEAPADGLFLAPTVFADDSNATTIAREEIFGPVLTVVRFGDEAEAVRLANGTDYGLAAGVWTSDLGRGHRMARALRAGTVWLNTYRAVFASAPFGGTGVSGFGRERGLEGLRDYTQTKNVIVDFSDKEE